jgi:hypothetical protein
MRIQMMRIPGESPSDEDQMMRIQMMRFQVMRIQIDEVPSDEIQMIQMMKDQAVIPDNSMPAAMAAGNWKEGSKSEKQQQQYWWLPTQLSS